MATYALTWDNIGEKSYEMGVDHGVLYPAVSGNYPKGVVWNGLTSVTNSPSGADEQTFWADNIKYGSVRGAEEFGCTIECFAYPPEWELCDGSIEPVKGVVLGQQSRKPFGFSYRSLIGDDQEDAQDADNGYKIHLIYNATASPSERQYQTVNDSPEFVTFSYEVTTNPIPVTVVPNARPISHIEVNSKRVDADKLDAFLQVLYGAAATSSTEAGVPRLPLPDEALTLLGYADATTTSEG